MPKKSAERQPEQPQVALTLQDALSVALTISKNRVIDSVRHHRGYDIVKESLKDLQGLYSISPRGNHIATKRCYYSVIKYDKRGEEEVTYLINLSNPLPCNCPDTAEQGTVTCKHAYAVMLWQAMYDIYNEHIRVRC